MSGWSCDWYGEWAYRERLAISDGTPVCCESGILIPAGMPYADCRHQWWDEDNLRPEEIAEYVPDCIPNDQLLPHLDVSPQCLEVWRFLRNDHLRRGACPAFGVALEQYNDIAWETSEREDQLAALHFQAVIKRARERYAQGKGPRLHPAESAALQSGEFVRAVGYTRRPARA